MGTNYERNCPTCGCTMKYTNKYNLKNAENKKSNCKSCGMKKILLQNHSGWNSDLFSNCFFIILNSIIFIEHH